jgi:hypothetical protein
MIFVRGRELRVNFVLDLPAAERSPRRDGGAFHPVVVSGLTTSAPSPAAAPPLRTRIVPSPQEGGYVKNAKLRRII